MKRLLSIIFLLLIATLSLQATEEGDSIVGKKKRQDVFHAIGRAFTKVFKGFNDIDTSYIEPQHYNYTVMLQDTYTYEQYSIESKSGQSITFSPRPTMKVGPYAGWRWLVLGYTIDINHLSSSDSKTEFDLSLYSSMLGIDLYYRKSGDSYKIRKVKLGDGLSENLLNGTSFDGLNVSIKGFDLYYIFNHRKFSYPAAFSQSTCQKRSCGSALLGIGYTSHSLSLDYERLEEIINDKVASTPQLDVNEVKLDSGLMFRKVKYKSLSISGGYAYNWVFAHNCLFSASLSLALAYKESSGDIEKSKGFYFKDFSFNNINIDGIGRFGIVWNSKKWYVGASTILHSYNYKKSQFSTNSLFGTLNIYAGFNFGKKREYKRTNI